MLRLRLIVFIASAILLSGCKSHPLPDDIPGPKTVDIVRHIRCEARYALGLQVIEFLGQRDNKKTKEYAKNLDADYITYAQLNSNEIDGDSRKILKKYENTALGYEFSFDILETNDHGGSIDFLNALNNGSEKSKIGSSISLQRKNTRNFIVIDFLGQLLTSDLTMKYCKLTSPQTYKYSNGKLIKNPLYDINSSADPIYPIRGHIGLKEVFSTFFGLNENIRLAQIGAAIKANGVPDTAPVFADQLEFQTIIKASVSPSIELKPVTQTFTIAGASITNEVSRTDLHKVQLALVMPSPDTPSSDASDKKSARPSPPAASVSPTNAGPSSPINSLQQKALDGVRRELERQRQNSFLNSLQRFDQYDLTPR